MRQTPLCPLRFEPIYQYRPGAWQTCSPRPTATKGTATGVLELQKSLPACRILTSAASRPWPAIARGKPMLLPRPSARRAAHGDAADLIR